MGEDGSPASHPVGSPALPGGTAVAILDGLPIGVFVVDGSGSPVYANAMAVELLGKGADPEVDADDLSSFYQVFVSATGALCPPDDLPVARAIAGESSHVDSLEIRTPDGTIAVEIWGGPLVDESGCVSHGVTIFSDITNAKRTDAALSIKSAELAQKGAELERLNTELTAITRLDPLTGLRNRRALEEDLVLLETRVARYGHRFCIALLDVDHFKSYNDSYGHPAGDLLLTIIAATLTGEARGGDALYRYGGDEFLCIFPEQSMADGAHAIERMRNSLQELDPPHAEHPEAMPTISAGVAILGADQLASEVIAEADEALYRAKQLGRNRVECANSQPA